MIQAPAQRVHPFFRYSAEVLSWRLGSPGEQPPFTPPTVAQTKVRVGRILRAAADRPAVILLGLGSGELAGALAVSLPPDIPLFVLSLDPEAARQRFATGQVSWLTPGGSRQLLVDTSEQALMCLLACVGCVPERCLITVNPESSTPQERTGLSRLRRLLSGIGGPLPAVEPSGTRPDVTLAVLARPNEPDLPGFLASVADLPTRVIIVWDAAAVPAVARQAGVPGNVPVLHLARPLQGDFAAQRNAMLSACPTGWVLYLDPDERPGPGFRDAVRRIMTLAGVGGAYFPRLTFYPDASRVKVGHGLWPDLQLRLFYNLPPTHPHFVRPIHERLEGLSGQAVLALDAPILHLNRLLTDDATVAGKLSAFSRAPGAPHHRLNREYPTLPLTFFTALGGDLPTGRVLLLPPLW